jgi:hypothetical protein
MRTLAMPKAAEPWLLAGLRATLISHGRYVTFQTADRSVAGAARSEHLFVCDPGIRSMQAT